MKVEVKVLLQLYGSDGDSCYFPDNYSCWIYGEIFFITQLTSYFALVHFDTHSLQKTENGSQRAGAGDSSRITNGLKHVHRITDLASTFWLVIALLSVCAHIHHTPMYLAMNFVRYDHT